MSCLSILRRIGLLPRIARSDIEAADEENIARSTVEHRRAVELSAAAAFRSANTSGRLRDTLQRARGTFAEMEPSYQRSDGRRRQR